MRVKTIRRDLVPHMREELALLAKQGDVHGQQ